VIGLEPDHIARVTLADVERWFYSHYAPDNAILSVTGSISFEKTVELAERWFADIPARHVAPRQLPDEGFPTENIVETVRANVPQTMIVMAFPMDSYGTARYHAADTVTDILSAGRASRFTRRLLYGEREGLFASAYASIMGSEHAGLLLLTARLADNSDEAIETARKMLLDEARQISVASNISEHEFGRISRRRHQPYNCIAPSSDSGRSRRRSRPPL